jgi:hypothetical protein
MRNFLLLLKHVNFSLQTRGQAFITSLKESDMSVLVG